MATNHPCILVIDSQPVLRMGMVSILTPAFANPKLSTCGSFADALPYLEKHPIDLVISDFRVNGETAVSLLGTLRKTNPATRCLIFSGQDEIPYGTVCMHAGAYGFLGKSSPPTKLVEAVRTVLDGRHYTSDRLARALMDSQAGASSPSPGTSLTPRELQIFCLIGEALAVSKIAVKLGLSVKTVEAHRENIKNKLGHPTAAHLAAAAVRWLDDTSVAI